MPDKILFLTLKTFSFTGGIEKVSRIAGKALFEMTETSGGLIVYSMYDSPEDVDEKYIPQKNFKGFGKKKLQFTIKSIQAGIKSDVVILSHINLLPIGFIIKLLSPKAKLLLFAHGIEVWKHFSPRQKKMLEKCTRLLAVSRYTKQRMIRFNQLPENLFDILNNCLDPFLKPPLNAPKNKELLKKYGFKENDIVLMTLTRLSSKEKYKGYDKIIEAVHILLKEYPNIKYLIIGKYDRAEKDRLDKIIKAYNLSDIVEFTGFLPDEFLAEHYNLADVYVMPSEKEGFGIVFIEAMYYGKPVIAGNKDGSVDALCNGELGFLVGPDNEEEIIGAIRKVINNKNVFLPDYDLLMDNFSYPVYKDKLNKILAGLRRENFF